MKAVALHQLTALEVDPLELVSLAADIGCQEVNIFVHIPTTLLAKQDVSSLGFPVLSPIQKKAMLARLRDCAIAVGNIEYYDLTPDILIDDFRASLALGGELGARGVVVHVCDPEERRAIDNLGRFCEAAAESGLIVGLEFHALAPGCESIQRAAYFVDHVRAPNFGIGVDALHLIRSGVPSKPLVRWRRGISPTRNFVMGTGFMPRTIIFPSAWTD